jgi:mannosylglucosylglycerate synthase
VPTCCFLSFRLGSTDGVSVVAQAWMEAFRSFGFDVVGVAGAGVVERTVPGLDIGDAEPPDRHKLEAALDDADLVVVENLLTIPLNLPASRVTAEVLQGRPTILHHHDPPWQRRHFRHVTELPATDPAWRHVTINRLTEAQMAQRGIRATTIYNGFDFAPVADARRHARERLAVDADEILVVHPVRAIPRKRIPDAIAFAEGLGATYWLSGRAEEGYERDLTAHLERARCRVIHRFDLGRTELYQAADVVVFPSTWEGFGNPPVEAAFHLRPVATGPYPVGRELADLGFVWFDAAHPAPVRAFLDDPDTEVLERNRRVAREHFSTEVMAARLHDLLEEAGWLP